MLHSVLHDALPIQLKEQTIDINIASEKGTILQENSCKVSFETNEFGNITAQSVSKYTGGLDNYQTERRDFRVNTDESGRLTSKFTDGSKFVEGKLVPYVLQAGFSYDEFGNYKVVTCDTLPKNGSDIKLLPEVFNSQIILFEYDDENMIKSIDMVYTYHDVANHEYQLKRFVVEYADGYISNIHIVGDDANNDEVFIWYEDGTVQVVKNVYDKEGTVIEKHTYLYERIGMEK